MADKKLLLLRHAQALAGHPLSDDFARPLSPEGLASAERLGHYLFRQKLIPDFVFCSSARRARQTWDCLSDAFETAPQTEFMELLYGASPRGLLQTIQAAPPETARLLLIAHNPGIAALARSLAGPASNRMEMEKMQFGYGPSDLAILMPSERPWLELTGNQTRLLQYMPAGMVPQYSV